MRPTAPWRAAGVPLLLFALVGAGCAGRGAMTPSLAGDLSSLGSDLDGLPHFPEPVPASGSLWTEAGPGAALVRDTRAFRVNDLITIRIAESTAGSNASTTDLSRASSSNFAAPFVFGYERLDEVLATESQSEFAGDGQTSRTSRLVGAITGRVMRVLPNGDLIVAGQKTVMVNRERQVLTLVGSIRPVDVGAANQVPSSAVGDLTVRMWGSGEINDTVRQGWFMRIMNTIWPF